jgi:tape measure domain-containing protein
MFSVGSVFGAIELADRFSKTFGSFFENMDRMSGSVAKAGAVMSGFSAGIAAVGVKAIQAAGEWEQTNIAFNTMLGSAEKAKAFLGDLQDFAAATPFELPQLVDGSRRLLAMGFAAEEVKPMLTAVGDAVAGLGGGGEMIQRVTLALGQMKAKGKVSAEEMRQLAEAGIPAWQFLADKIGKSIPEAMKMAEQGTIKAADAIPALIAGMNDKFGGMMEAQSKTFMGQLSTLKDQLGFVMRDIGTALMPIAQTMMSAMQKLVPIIQSVASAFRAASPEVKTFVGVVGLAAAATGPAILGVAGLMKVIAGVQPAVAGAAAALKALDMNTTVMTARLALMETGMATTVGSSALLTAGAVALGAAIGLTLGNALAETGEKWSQFDQATVDAVDKIGLFEGAMSLIPDLASAVGDKVSGLVNWFTGLLDTIQANIGQIPILGSMFNGLKMFVESNINAVKQLWQDLSMLTVAFEKLGTWLFQVPGAAQHASAQARDLAAASAIVGDKVTDWAEAQHILMQHGKTLLPVQKEATKQAQQQATISAEAARKAVELKHATDDIAKAQKIAGDSVKTHADALVVLKAAGLEPASAASSKFQKELDKQAEKLKGIRDSFTGASAAAEMMELQKALQGVNLEAGLSFEGKNSLVDKLNNLESAGAQLPPVFEEFRNALRQARLEAEQMGPTMDQLQGKAMTGVSNLKSWNLGGSFGKDLLFATPAAKTSFVAAGTEGGTFIGKGIGEGIRKSVGKALEGLGGVIIGAIQGGGDVGKAIGAHLGNSIGEDLGKMLGDKIGGTLGKTLGGLAGPLGALAGSFLGDKLGGLVGKLFGGEEKKVNDLRDAFFQAQGGFVALQQKLAGLSNQDLVKKIFDAKTVDQFNRAVAEAQGLLNLQSVAQEKVTAALDKYGIGLEKTGAQFAQGKLNEQAMAFFEEFELLTKGAGVSVSDAIAAMGEGGFTDFVNTARAAGATIPEAMRPMVEALIASGQLLDENGEAFGSAEEAGITFATTVEESMVKLVEQIERMVNALLGIPNEVSTNVRVTGQYEGGYKTDPDLEIPETSRFAHYGVVTKPTVAMVGEAGPEAIMPMYEAMGDGQWAPLKVQLSERVLIDTLVQLKQNNAHFFDSDF